MIWDELAPDSRSCEREEEDDGQSARQAMWPTSLMLNASVPLAPGTSMVRKVPFSGSGAGPHCSFVCQRALPVRKRHDYLLWHLDGTHPLCSREDL